MKVLPWIVALLIFVPAPFMSRQATAVFAQSMTCAEVSLHVKAANAAHAHATVYLSDGNDSMYHAEMDSVIHEIHLVADDIERCPSKAINVSYWRLKAEMDYLKALEHEPDDEKRSLTSGVARSLAVVAWTDLAIMNSMGPSHEKSTYSLLKQHVRERFKLLGMDWVSPEAQAGPQPGSWLSGVPRGVKTTKSGQICSNTTIVAEAIEVANLPITERLQSYGATAPSVVNVSLDAAGNVLATSIIKSSGVPEFDESVLSSARLSKYSPELVNCVPHPASFRFEANYGG